MKPFLKFAVAGLLAAAIAVVVIAKSQRPAPLANAAPSTQPATAAAPLPRLVDLGAHTCIPCKKMAPILEELRTEYAGRLQVEFIDVRENVSAAQKYGIHLIPTQIFFDAAGKELDRHEGFMAKQDILARFKELGVPLPAPAQPE